MFPPTIITWILIISGLITCVPLLCTQFMFILNPHGKRVRDIVIGKDKDWRDETHFQSAIGGSRADWIVFAPPFIPGMAGVILGDPMGICSLRCRRVRYGLHKCDPLVPGKEEYLLPGRTVCVLYVVLGFFRVLGYGICHLYSCSAVRHPGLTLGESRESA